MKYNSTLSLIKSHQRSYFNFSKYRSQYHIQRAKGKGTEIKYRKNNIISIINFGFCLSIDRWGSTHYYLFIYYYYYISFCY